MVNSLADSRGASEFAFAFAAVSLRLRCTQHTILMLGNFNRTPFFALLSSCLQANPESFKSQTTLRVMSNAIRGFCLILERFPPEIHCQNLKLCPDFFHQITKIITAGKSCWCKSYIPLSGSHHANIKPFQASVSVQAGSCLTVAPEL